MKNRLSLRIKSKGNIVYRNGIRWIYVQERKVTEIPYMAIKSNKCRVQNEK